MLKQKDKKIKLKFAIVALSIGILLSVATMVGSKVVADQFDQQIQQLQAQNAQNQQTVDQLAAQASSYQDAINLLSAQINDLQQQIVANQNKEDELNNQITAAQAELDQQKKTLGEDIKAMYLEGKTSTLEMLASSNNISDFVNRQTYRNSVQNKVKDTLDKITLLKQQLVEQKNAVDSLLSQQQSIRSQLSSDESKQNQMLAYTEGQQAAYTQQIQDNQSKIASLIAQQRAANNSGRNGALIAGASSYPYADWGFSMSTAPGCVNNDGPDAWGYCTRQCVSYAAWAVAHSGRSAPLYYGNAADWVWHALRDNVPVYSFTNPDGYSGVQSGSPQPGDVAISTSGGWGHAMYIEGVSGTQIWVSQYNANLDGQFTHQWRDASSYYFLRFQ